METKYVSKEQKGNEAKTTLASVLSEANFFENVECEINGKVRIMNEYRILVEPNSDVEKQLCSLLYG